MNVVGMLANPIVVTVQPTVVNVNTNISDIHPSAPTPPPRPLASFPRASPLLRGPRARRAAVKKRPADLPQQPRVRVPRPQVTLSHKVTSAMPRPSKRKIQLKAARPALYYTQYLYS